MKPPMEAMRSGAAAVHLATCLIKYLFDAFLKPLEKGYSVFLFDPNLARFVDIATGGA